MDNYEEQEAKLAQIEDWFKRHDEQYLQFNQIPDYAKKSQRPDLCAFIYLNEGLPTVERSLYVIDSAGHDKVYLGWNRASLSHLTEEDVIYLLRCSIRFNGNALYMLV